MGSRIGCSYSRGKLFDGGKGKKLRRAVAAGIRPEYLKKRPFTYEIDPVTNRRVDFNVADYQAAYLEYKGLLPVYEAIVAGYVTLDYVTFLDLPNIFIEGLRVFLDETRTQTGPNEPEGHN